MLKKLGTLLLRVILGVLAAALIVFGVVGIRDYLWHLLVAGILILILDIFWGRMGRESAARIFRTLRTLMLVLVLMWAVLDGVMIVMNIRAAGSNADATAESTMVVLGTDVDGEEPGDLLRLRLETAAAYLKEHPDMPVIVTGCGRGEHTEAEVMNRFLIASGIAEERIYQEPKAQSTLENFTYSKEIIESNGLPQDMLVVTNNYHQWRASLYAKKAQVSTHRLSAPTTGYMLFPLSERERYIILVEEWLGIRVDVVNKYGVTV